ncbi:hypothetical protein FHR95_003235 [Halomonas fontilapidosi]|uniref:Uncharacterized protein n=1 Tax=Halomonas fontilapidosi TaxID=616675 RepID=A0A7W5H0L2_9GAMM|nr:hypothetical protein [Halomonas fontilapidosi]MBB3185644.1 hypothetical protein [Halomonas fontilapidosi]
MAITQYLGIIFSRPRWRHVLAAALVAHLIVGGYATLRELFYGMSLSLIMDGIQFALIQAALFLLYFSSSRMENVRYSLDTQFYVERYFKERHRFLAMKRHGQGGFKPQVGLTSADTRRLGNRRDLIVSQSLLEYQPPVAATIQDLAFRLENNWFDLPWVVADQALELTLKRFNALEKYDYNGLLMSVTGLEQHASGTTLVFEKATYYSYLVTNMLPEVEMPGGLTYRDMLEPGPVLSTLETSLPENHLGLNCLFRTRDGDFIIPRRSHNTNVFKGQLSASVSGASNLHTCRLGNQGTYSPLAWLINETREELPFLFTEAGQAVGDDAMQALLGEACFLGITRELRRCGKPEAFFFFSLPITTDEVRQRLRAHLREQGDHPISMSEIRAIDFNENAGFLLVQERALFEGLGQHVLPGRRVVPFTRPKPPEFQHRLAYEGESYVVSESLFVNLLLYQNHCMNG